MRRITALLLGISLAAGPAALADTLYDVNGFEGYALGPVAGQSLRGNIVDPAGLPKWIADSNDRLPGTPAPVADIVENQFTMSTGHNKVLLLDPSSLSTNDYAGAYLPFTDDLVALGENKITIEFDQFRNTLDQSAFVLENSGPARSDSSWTAFEYGLNGQIYPTGRVSNAGVPLTASAWQHIRIDLDFEAQTVAALVDGVAPTPNPQTWGLGNGGVKAFRGIGLRVYGTDRGAPNGPNYFDNLSVRGSGGAVPEPSSLALLAVGVLPFLRRRR